MCVMLMYDSRCHACTSVLGDKLNTAPGTTPLMQAPKCFQDDPADVANRVGDSTHTLGCS